MMTSLEIGCAPSSSPPPDEIFSTPGEPVGGRTQGGTTAALPIVAAAAAGGGCDDFGTLNAASLTGKLASVDGTLRQTLALTVDGRPSRTKASIIVNGDPAALVGQTVTLGVGNNADAFTCTHCVLVAVGCSASSCGQAAFFFPRGGSASLNAVASYAGQPFSGALTDVELQQVTIDMDARTMTPVEGGACIRIPRLTFGATMTATGAIVGPPADAGAADAAEDSATGGGTGSGIGGAIRPSLDGGTIEADGATGGGGGGEGNVESPLANLFN